MAHDHGPHGQAMISEPPPGARWSTDEALREGMSLGVGYGIWAACGVALTAVLSAVIFHEPLTLPMGIGIAAVMGGVLLVGVALRLLDVAQVAVASLLPALVVAPLLVEAVVRLR